MMLILSIILAVVPIIFYLIILIWLDKYEKEPIKLIIVHFLWGALGAIIFSYIFSFTIDGILQLFIDDIHLLDILSSTFTAPLVEETFKGILLIFTVSLKKFDNLTDGFIYGGSIGLGFGMTENFLYFIFAPETTIQLINLAFFRTIFTTGVHFAASSTFGAVVGFSKFKLLKTKIFYILVGLFIAIGIHSIWNYSVYYRETFVIGLIFTLTSLPALYFVLQFSLFFEKNIIYYEMNDEIKLGYLKKEYASSVADLKKRNSKGWIPEQYRKEYVSLATTLAFRKNQIRNLDSQELKLQFENEITKLRIRLHEIEAAADE